MRLYDLTEQYNTLAEMLEDDADNESLRAMLDGIDGAFDEKVESIVKLMKSKQGDLLAVESEAKRLNERAAKIKKGIEWFQQYIEDQMKQLGKEEVKSNLFSIKLGLNPHKVNVIDEACIPEYYFNIPEVKPQLDKRRLAEALKSGEYAGPGASLIQDKTLKIK